MLTKDDLKITVVASVITRPTPAEVHLLEQEIGPDYYQRVVQPKFRTAIRNVLADYAMIQISKNTRKIEEELKTTLSHRLSGRHLDVHDVIIDDIAFSQPVLRAIESKLSKEQEQEQRKFEVLIAQKDAEIAKIRADGQAQAEIAKAKGLAEAQRIMNDSLSDRVLQFKALESPNSKYFFIPANGAGIPVMISPDGK